MILNDITYSDYLIFADESGDHGLASIDPEFPIFSLVFVLIKKTDYIEKVVPAFQSIKMKYRGHDQIVFHEHEIRKEKGSFGILRTSSSMRTGFMTDLTGLISDAPFQYVASVIHKDRLIQKYDTPYSPYQIGMLFCLEQIMQIFLRNDQIGKMAHIVIEGRGAKEDKDLELEFRRICDNQGNWGYKAVDFRQVPFNLICADKKTNSSGLQLADLIARPIALKRLRPTQENRTYKTLDEKKGIVKCFP